MKNKFFKVLVLLFLPLSFAVADINVMALNAEWLWTPFDQKVDGQKFNKGDMSPQKYNQEITFYADLIKKNNISLLAISEIENGQVAHELATKFGSAWKSYFRQGRDTATGQDVALLSSLPLVPGSVTDFGFPSGKIKGSTKKKRLSKVLGAQFWIEKGSAKVKLGVITAHFLSKRHDSKKKSENRHRQAKALVKAIESFHGDVDALIVMGDFNDYLGSRTLDILTDYAELKAVKHASSKWQIDHILYRGLGLKHSDWISLKHHSDHKAIMAGFD